MLCTKALPATSCVTYKGLTKRSTRQARLNFPYAGGTRAEHLPLLDLVGHVAYLYSSSVPYVTFATTASPVFSYFSSTCLIPNRRSVLITACLLPAVLFSIQSRRSKLTCTDTIFILASRSFSRPRVISITVLG